jgi:hypothetical protein
MPAKAGFQALRRMALEPGSVGDYATLMPGPAAPHPRRVRPPCRPRWPFCEIRRKFAECCSPLFWFSASLWGALSSLCLAIGHPGQRSPEFCYLAIVHILRRPQWLPAGRAVAESIVTLPRPWRTPRSSAPNSTPSGAPEAASAAGGSAFPMPSIAGRNGGVCESALAALIIRNRPVAPAIAKLRMMSSLFGPLTRKRRGNDRVPAAVSDMAARRRQEAPQRRAGTR